jgi:uncharacterized damage-inducible protein DinB
MIDTPLSRAVVQFADLTQGRPDLDLDRAWAWGPYDSEGVRFAFFRTYEDLRELAVRITSDRLARGPAVRVAQRILTQYHAAYRDLEALLLGVDDEVADQAPADEEWSVRQVVTHIIGADLGFYGVVKYALDHHRTGGGRPARIPDEAWDELLGEEEAQTHAALGRPLSGLQAYYAAHHGRVLREYAEITDEELAAPSIYWEEQEMSLRFRLHRFDSHLRQHVVQIEKTLAVLGRPPNEAKRLLRLIYAALAEVEGAVIGAWEVGVERAARAARVITARTEEIAGILGGGDDG